MSSKPLLTSVVLVVVAVVVSRCFSDSQPEENKLSKKTLGNPRQIYSAGGYSLGPLSPQQIETLAKGLTPEERHIILEEGTERAFTGALVDNKKKGLYACRLCGLPLYESDTKFDSGSGWPSFFKPMAEDHVREEKDTKFGMVRIEVECARCRSHLGHVFNDGPRPTGLRYCINSASLKFHEKGADLPGEAKPAETATAYFAGGCFWGVEDRFQQVPGVLDAVSGYQGGHVENPTYYQVCYSDTGHAESVRVVYDKSVVTYRQLLERFFEFHNPTQKNRQGPDYGTQYRSAIFAADEEQLKEAKAFIEEQQKSEAFRGKKIETIVQMATPFYEAEEHHQDYHAKHGGSCSIDATK